MKEHQILFSTPMVKAIMEGQKTQTRRIIDPQPDIDGLHNDTDFPRSLDSTLKGWNGATELGQSRGWKCRYGQPGDRLFVRESWRIMMWDFEESEVRIGFADGEEIAFETPDDDNDNGYEWMVRQFEKSLDKGIIAPNADDESPIEFTGKPNPFNPSIHLPKCCSRIWLEVVSVHVERVADISEVDAKSEGASCGVLRGGPNVLKGEFQLEHNNHGTYKEGFQFLWYNINPIVSWHENQWVWVIAFKVLSTTGKP